MECWLQRYLHLFAVSYPFCSPVQTLMPETYTLGVRRTPNQTDSVVTFSRSCAQGKITKK